VWTRLDDPTDPISRAALVSDLRRIEHELSAYRHDLHERIAAATAETIARSYVQTQYSLEDPSEFEREEVLEGWRELRRQLPLLLFRDKRH